MIKIPSRFEQKLVSNFLEAAPILPSHKLSSINIYKEVAALFIDILVLQDF
jgi:hypothetical protein